MAKHKFIISFHTQEIEFDTDAEFDGPEVVDANDPAEVAEVLQQMIDDGTWEIDPAEVDEVKPKK